jgi:hypothetical protein
MLNNKVGRKNILDYLTHDTPQQLVQMHKLWDRYSGLPGLLDGIRFIYDPEKGQYRDSFTGKYISQTQLRTAVQKVSAESDLRMRQRTQRYITGAVILLLWFAQMREEMKSLYLSVWLASIGGLPYDTPKGRTDFYQMVASQFDYMDSFALQLESGKSAALGRAGMYGEYGNGFFQNIGLDRALKRGFKRAKRILGPNENHCNDNGERPGCLELAQIGWMPIRAMVPIGDAACYSNCKCRIIYK